MKQFARVHVRTGKFACHSCMTEGKGKHIDIHDWGRLLCLDCASTLGMKMKEIAALSKEMTTDQGILFKEKS